MGPTEIRKSILIVKSQPKSLAAVESFLRNRGWKIQATTDLKEALQVLVQVKPSFVMISVDHPNKKVRALPKLLVQSFPVFVMGFSESNTTLAYKALIDSGAPYRINPPVTGPAIERTINKIIRDQELEREKQAAAERASKMAKEMMDRGEEQKSEKQRSRDDGVLSHAGADDADADAITAIGGEGDGGHLKFPDSPGAPPHGKGKKGGASNADVLARVANLNDNDSDDESESALLSVLQSAAQNQDRPSGDDGGVLFSKDEKTGSPAFGGADSLGGSPQERGSLFGQSGESETLGSGAPGDTFIEQDGRNAGTMAGGAAYMPGAQGTGGSRNSRGYRPGESGGPLGGDGSSDEGGDLFAPDAMGRKPGEPGYAPEFKKSRKESGFAGHSSHDDGDEAGGAFHGSKKKKKRSGHADDDAESLVDPDDVILGKSKDGDATGGRKQTYHHDPSEKALPQYDEAENGDRIDVAKPAPDFGGEANRKNKNAPSYEDGEAESLTGKADAATAAKKKPDDGKIRIKGSTGWQKNDNIVVRGTQKALDDTANLGDGEIKQKLEGGSSNVACLVVESEKFSGYLVAALGKNRKIDAKFIETLKDRLSKFLKENGEPMKEENSMSLKIKPVDFEDWALEYADFLRKSVHEGEEIAMAFFPFADAKTVVETSAQADMGAVKIDELQGDVGVDFNLYVYLPANKKYVLYTPRGSKFYGNQKDRLSRMGVTHMHVKRTELQDVSKYRAQNYLNSKIQEFEKKKSTNRAS